MSLSHTNTQWRRILNQHMINNTPCSIIRCCHPLFIQCSNYNIDNKMPCHSWKISKIIRLLKGDQHVSHRTQKSLKSSFHG